MLRPPSRLLPPAPMLALLLALTLGAGCHPSNVCGTHDEPLLGADGGQPGCTRAEDCPREHDELVCQSNAATPDHSCVRCESGACARTVLEMCP